MRTKIPGEDDVDTPWIPPFEGTLFYMILVNMIMVKYDIYGAPEGVLTPGCILPSFEY